MLIALNIQAGAVKRYTRGGGRYTTITGDNGKLIPLGYTVIDRVISSYPRSCVDMLLWEKICTIQGTQMEKHTPRPDKVNLM